MASQRSLVAWAILIGGMMFTSLLGAFLLTVTGRAIQVHDLMDARAQADAHFRLARHDQHSGGGAIFNAQLGEDFFHMLFYRAHRRAKNDGQGRIAFAQRQPAGDLPFARRQAVIRQHLGDRACAITHQLSIVAGQINVRTKQIKNQPVSFREILPPAA